MSWEKHKAVGSGLVELIMESCFKGTAYGHQF